MRKLLVLIMVLVMVGLPLFSHADSRDTVNGGIRGVSDSDSLQITELFTGYQNNYDAGEFVGLEVGKTTYEDPDGSEDFVYIKVEGRKNIFKDTYIRGGIRYNKSGNWSPVTGDVSAVWDKNPVRVETSYSRSVVESQLAIQNEIMWNTFGVSLDYQISTEYILSGMFSYTDSTDGNSRTTEGASLTYRPEEDPRFHVKTRARWFQSKRDPNEYWSPVSYAKYDVMFGYQEWLFNRMWLQLQAGPGYEFSDGDTTPTYEYSIVLNYDLNETWTIKSYFGGFGVLSGDSYEYNWYGVSLNHYW